MEALSEKFSLADMAKSFQMYRCKNSQFEDKECGSLIYLMAYILICKQGLACENPETHKLYSFVQEEIQNRSMYAHRSFSSIIDSLKVHNIVDVPRYVRKTKEAITSGNNLTAFNEWTNVAITRDPCLWGELYSAINSNQWSNAITQEQADYLRAKYL